jgi:hypothetical protein
VGRVKRARARLGAWIFGVNFKSKRARCHMPECPEDRVIPRQPGRHLAAGRKVREIIVTTLHQSNGRVCSRCC